MKSLNKQSLNKKEYKNDKSLHNHEYCCNFIQDKKYYFCPCFLLDKE